MTDHGDSRIPIHEGIAWKDADGRTFQTWEVYEAVKDERDRLRKAVFAVRHMIDPHNPCHDGMREALLDALAEHGRGEL